MDLDLDLYFTTPPMAANQYPGVSVSLERWMWYADRELRGLRHELEQSNARRDGDI